MADFSSLKQTILTYIKQNGNEEITGNILQDVLLAMVSTMGDSAINSLASALQDETTERQNQDGILQGNITAEATARQQADTALGGRIDGLQTAINGINTKLAEGYIYAGIATPSTNPGTPSGKVFYIAIQTGTYTNFSNLTAAQGINILKYNGSAWSKDVVYAIDARPKKNSQNPVTSGGVFDNMGALDVSELNATENPHTPAIYADLSAALAAISTDYQKGGMSVKFVQSYDNKYVQYRLMADAWSTTSTDWQGVDAIPTPESKNMAESGGIVSSIFNDSNCAKTASFSEYTPILLSNLTLKQGDWISIKPEGTWTRLIVNYNNNNGNRLLDLKSTTNEWIDIQVPEDITILGGWISDGTASYTVRKGVFAQESGNSRVLGMSQKAINDTAQTLLQSINTEKTRAEGAEAVLQQNIDDTGFNVFDLTNKIGDIKTSKGYIQSDSTFNSSGTGTMTAYLPVRKGDIIIFGTSLDKNYYNILSETPAVNATGFSGRTEIPQSNELTEIEITQDDAKYFAFRVDKQVVEANLKLPSRLVKKVVNTDIDNTPTIGSDKYVTSGGIYRHNLFGEEIVYILPEYVTLSGYIKDDRTFIEYASTKTTFVPVKKGDILEITVSESDNYYALLPSIPSYNDVVAKGKFVLNQRATPYTIEITDDDTLYFAIRTDGESGNTFAPSSLIHKKAGYPTEVSKLRGKKLSIIGDSISSYEDMPYPNSGYSTAYPRATFGVSTYKQCWWGRLCQETGMQLLRNASWSGSKVTGNTASTDSAASGASTKRINDLSDGVSVPDIVICYIGINDWIDKQNVISLGTFDPTAIVPEDSSSVQVFVDAYMIMLAKIMNTYPKAHIFCCTLTTTAHDTHDPDQKYPDINRHGVALYSFNEAIKQICDGMGIDVIDTNKCGLNFDNLSVYADYDLIHPNPLGMDLIYKRVKAEILSKY